MRIIWASLFLSGLFLCGVSPAAEGVQQCRRSWLPTNIMLTHDLDRVLLDLYERSPTFRAQCNRLAAAANLSVVVHLDVSLPKGCRALTRFWRRGREIRTDVHVPPGSGLVELIAHEFEHVIEQVGGLDMRRLARRRRSGVWQVEREWFESDRAVRAGQIVASEAWRTKAPSAD
jgi:hypothetical protein